MRTIWSRSLAIGTVAAALLGIGATPVAAVTGLDLSTPYPSVQVDPGGEVTFPLIVGTTAAETVGLEVRTAPEGFETIIRGGGFVVSSVFSDPQVEEPPELELEVQVPDDAAPAEYDVQLVATGSLGETPLDLTLTVGETDAGTISLETEIPSVRGDSSETFSFDLTLSNDTAQEVTFGLEAASPPGWDVTPTFSGEEQAATSVVGAGETATVNVQAVATQDVPAGLYDILVRASGGEQVAEAAVQIEITGSYAMELTTSDGRLNATVTGGGSTTLPLLVQNTGTADLTAVTLSADPPQDWEVTFDQETVAVPVGDEVVVNATISPTGNAVSGDYVLTINADSDQASDDIEIRTTVETSTIWGFVGIALIALVVIGLLLVFPAVRTAMTGADTVAIRTRGLEKQYGELVAVRDLDLEVHQGEVFGLLGPNGAGKTTTILMLLGLTEPTRGEALVLGMDPARRPLEVKRHVGYLPDNVGFYGSLTGKENLRYTARLNGIEARDAEERIDRLLDQVELQDAGDSPVETYSRGMRQRLGLADALIKEPSVVILDEPTTAIDPTGVIETLALVRSLAHEQGAAVLLSSHLLHQVQQVCDRIAIFVSGEVVATGTVEELAERQSRGVVSSFEVGADGDPAAVAETLRGVEGITAVEQDQRDGRIWIVSGEPETRQRVAQALVAAGQTPWHLRTRGMELNEIYQRYFTGATLPPSHRARTAEAPSAERTERPTTRASTATRSRQRRAIHRSSRRSASPPPEADRDG